VLRARHDLFFVHFERHIRTLNACSRAFIGVPVVCTGTGPGCIKTFTRPDTILPAMPGSLWVTLWRIECRFPWRVATFFTFVIYRNFGFADPSSIVNSQPTRSTRHTGSLRPRFPPSSSEEQGGSLADYGKACRRRWC